ncbi:hypothetical protein OJAV_G00134430 [Oryzias javanicus]|uniref:G-protein coupled receptors family 1 profile domain-containing protein n=1 Tax=Oryzias javanicus TaxID=123683 RepID=A0A437CR40_ORYJA|nr:hypothetical protein OJAV_G00134430 [Oryzias javanicus]
MTFWLIKTNILLLCSNITGTVEPSPETSLSPHSGVCAAGGVACGQADVSGVLLHRQTGKHLFSVSLQLPQQRVRDPRLQRADRRPSGGARQAIRMSNSSNASAGGAPQCIVNDHMGAFIVLYILILIVGLPGNLLSSWAFIRCCKDRSEHGAGGEDLNQKGHRSRDKRSSRVYLLNLLVTNFLFLAALPFKVLNDLGAAPWSLKVFHCQCSAVATYISLYASVAFLALVIVDRYLQDRNMARSLRLQEPGFAWLLCGVVWLLLLLIMVPNMALPTKKVQVQTYLSCVSLKEELGLRWHTLSVFLNTALFLNASAAVLVSGGLALKHLLRRRSAPARRAVVSMAVLALAYVLSFVPYHAVRTPYTLAQTRVITDCRTRRRLFLGKEATLALSMLHVCLDPLLFFYLDAPFRGVVRGLLPRAAGCTAAADGPAAEETQPQTPQEDRTEASQL